MNSVDELTRKGEIVDTGEKWSRIEGKRDFISFTDSLTAAINYFSMGTSENNSFPMTIGISEESLKGLRKCTVFSDLPEIGIMNEVPIECIKLLMVPDDKVKFVQKLVNGRFNLTKTKNS